MKDLWAAEENVVACTAAHPNLATAWKLLGDIRLQWHTVAPPTEPGPSGSPQFVVAVPLETPADDANAPPSRQHIIGCFLSSP